MWFQDFPNATRKNLGENNRVQNIRNSLLHGTLLCMEASVAGQEWQCSRCDWGVYLVVEHPPVENVYDVWFGSEMRIVDVGSVSEKGDFFGSWVLVLSRYVAKRDRHDWDKSSHYFFYWFIRRFYTTNGERTLYYSTLFFSGKIKTCLEFALHPRNFIIFKWWQTKVVLVLEEVE